MAKLLTVTAGWIARAVVVGCSFVNVRLLLDLVGIEGFAAFSIVMSLAPWLTLLNLGVPNATQNLIAELRAKNRDPRRLHRAAIDTALAAGIFYLPVALICAGLVCQLLLPGHGTVSFSSVAILLWSLIASGLTMVFYQVLHALHRSTWPVLAPAVQAALTAGLLFLADRSQALGLSQLPPKDMLGALATALPIIGVFLLSAQIVGARLHLRIDTRALRRLLHTARSFLVFGFTGTAALSCDYIVMSRLLASAELAQYNLVSKVFSTILTLHSVLLSTTWTPLSDKFFHGDLTGMRRLLLRLLGIGAALIAIVGIPLTANMDHIVRLLSGGRFDSLPISLTLGWLLYVAMRIWSDTFATALLSSNQLSIINLYIVWQAIISILAQWLLGSHFGATGIVLGTLFSFILTASWILPMQFLSVTRTVRTPHTT